MKTINFPYIALSLCSILLLLVLRGRHIGPDGATEIPLLTLLVVSEFSFIVTAIGAYIGFKECRSKGIVSIYTLATVSCLLLSIYFMLLGIDLWPL